MTFREAIAQAYRELGIPEDKIAVALKHADKKSFSHPLFGVVDKEMEHPPGRTDRDLIDQIKKRIVSIRAADKDKLREICDAHSKRISTNN